MAQPRQRLAEDRPGGHLREVGVDDLPRHSDVAAELYQARVRRGIDLAVVANELRIHYEQLLALEEGRFDDLPGPTYVIGFLRSYAGFLDLDADDLVRRFKDETAYRDSRPDLTFPSPQDEGRVPTSALIALSLALVGAAYGGWHYVASVDRVVVEKVPAPPQSVIAEVAPEPAPAVTEAAPLSLDAITEFLAVTAEEPADTRPAEPEEPAAVAPDPVESAIVVTEEISQAEAPVVDQVVDQVVDPVADPAPAAVEPEAAPVVAAIPDPEPVAIEIVAPETVEAEQPEPEVAALDVAEPEIVEPVTVDPEIAATQESEPVEPVAQALAPMVAEPTEPEPELEETASLMPEAPAVDGDIYVPREFGLANAGSTIRLRARLESWIQVTGADNELLVTRILRPGDVYHVPDRPNLVLMTGNAGGIEILVGDQVAPSLGAVGAIQRRVALDPEKLLAGTATN